MKKTKVKNKSREQKAITLIALVITIIVLLILAAVSIATLTGQNGILTQASNAKNTTNEKGALEAVQMEIAGSFDEGGNYSSELAKRNLENNLGATVTDKGNGSLKVEYKGYNFDIDIKGNTSQIVTIVDTGDTAPFLPEGATVKNNDLSTGIVIEDSKGNEWVWIEVPKSIYTNATYNGGTEPTSSEDYGKIESVMQTYASEYRKSGYTDTWYSEEQHGFASEEEYNNHKNNMLKNVYENGGFYIGRYEVGTETARSSETDELTTPIIKQDAYPYNYVTCKQAQDLADLLAPKGKTSSLMFGIQWDLVLKHIETKGGKTQDELKLDSRTWGNYQHATFDIERGQYATVDGDIFTPVESIYTKRDGSHVLLTTGATERNSTLNIYDLAGNIWEWTLEYTALTDSPCSAQGGGYWGDDFYFPASERCYYSTTDSDVDIGFRPALY